MAIDTTTGPHAVKPIRDFLTRFTPVQKTIFDPENITLTYDILNWTHTPTQPPPSPNTVYGSLTIQRNQGESEIQYHIGQQTRISGQPTVLTADITCNPDHTFKSGTLKTHRLDNEGNSIPISELRENWTNSNGQIQSQDGTYEYHVNHPVLSHWCLPHLLMNQELSLSTKFDMLQDLSVLRPNQVIINDGPIDLDSGSYNTNSQTGEGILPTHYLLDKNHRPQLITFGLIAWALTDIT